MARSVLKWRTLVEHLQQKVVVVDDDGDILAFLQAYLGILGYEVVICRFGRDALACIAEHRPDLVILDLQLGDTDGVDVVHSLRAGVGEQTPIIFFTGADDQLNRRLPDYRGLGARLVVKPDVERLGALVQEILQRRP